MVSADFCLLSSQCFCVVRRGGKTFHALCLSVGEIVDVLRATAEQAQETVGKLLQELQASPVVHGDETTWREDGRNGYMWAFSTPVLRYFLYRASRSGEIVNEVLGEAFDGTLVTDFYAGYNRMLGRHQRCWAHLLRDIHTLKEQWPAEAQLHLWADKVHALFQQACAYGQSHEQAKPKERRLAQQQFEQELLALCQPHLSSDCAQRVLCKRIEHFLSELFTFVADPRVPPDNNAAERSIRPLAVSRKISGGTRSEQGTQTKSVLATIFGTWIVRGINPFHACLALLIPP
jgi:transposase